MFGGVFTTNTLEPLTGARVVALAYLLAGLDVGDEPLQGRPLYRAAGIPSVIIQRWQRPPAFVSLGQDKGRASFALGVQRIERLLQTLLGRFAGIDRTTNPLAGPLLSLFGLRHHVPPWSDVAFPPRARRKRGPDQCVPVIFLAILLSDD